MSTKVPSATSSVIGLVVEHDGQRRGVAARQRLEEPPAGGMVAMPLAGRRSGAAACAHSIGTSVSETTRRDDDGRGQRDRRIHGTAARRRRP